MQTERPHNVKRPNRAVPELWWLAVPGISAAVAVYGLATTDWIVLHTAPELLAAAILVLTALLIGAAALGREFGRRERPAGDDDVLATGFGGTTAQTVAAGSGGTATLVHDILDGLSDGFMLWDADDRLLLYNQRMDLPTLGSRAGLRPGLPFADYVKAMFPEIDPQSTGGNIEAWTARREAWHRAADSSYEIRMKSGRWILLSERRTPSGATIGVYTDITERKESDQRLRQSERRLAHAQKLASVGIWEWDTRTREMYWSDILYEIVGLPADMPPLTLDQYSLLVHPANRDIVRSTYSRLLTSGGQFNQEYQIIRPNGETRTLRTEAEAILDDRGVPVRVIGAVHDMTNLKRAERAMRKAMEAADQANRAKSEFLANVSHELRTPLNAIIGFSEVMIEEVFGPFGNERYRDYAVDIRHSGAHLLAIINDLLDYAKLEAGRLELHAEPVSVATVIENSLRLVRDRADEAEVAIVSKLAGAPATIEGDDRKIMQILLNLLSNAIKFTPKGGVVTVTAQYAGDGVEIRVSDTGIGMSPSDIEVALAPFGQVDSTVNRAQTGTGLGLPLSRALAELHGGTLEIESATGQGSTVRVILPRVVRRAGGPRPGDRTLRLVTGGQAG